MSTESIDPAIFAQALVHFTSNGHPAADPELAEAHLTNPALRAALGMLINARSELEDEIKSISRNNAPDIDQWIQNAKTLRVDTENSRVLARSIINSASRESLLKESINVQSARIAFIEKEQIYNQQVSAALKGIKKVHSLLDEVTVVGSSNRTLDALNILAEAALELHRIPALASGRPMIMLEDQYEKVHGALYEQFLLQWNYLINVDKEAQSITIKSEIPGGGLDLDSVLNAMKAFHCADKLMKQLADDLKEAIFKPRFKLNEGELPLFEFEERRVRISKKHSNCDVQYIIQDLEQLIKFLSSNLPVEIQTHLSQACSSYVSDHIISTWLDRSVPVRLGDEMTKFRHTMSLVLEFAETLQSLGWEGNRDFMDWIEGCAKIWLGKRKEYCLDWVRNQMALGIGNPREVERVETELIKQDESADAEDWDANWDDDEHENNDENKTEDDGDAWGAEWGFDDDVKDVLPDAAHPSQRGNGLQKQPEATNKIVTLTEFYKISSMPTAAIDSITAIIEDALELSDPQSETNPITPAAAGLFSIPALVLAMYRAVAPYHYRLHPTGGGKMFQYNDALWLNTQLEKIMADWESRSNIAPRAYGKLKLNPEIEKLQRWGKNAYTEEFNEQKTIILDLMGGAQSFLSANSDELFNISGGWGREESPSVEDKESEVEKMIDGVVAKIRDTTAAWEKILSKSAWVQASGRLLSVVAKKIVADIQDRDSLSSKECELVARIIDKVLKLGDLFIPTKSSESGTTTTTSTTVIPVTSSYTEGWLRMQWLKEILESNLKDLVWLWRESELGLEWGVEEVIELIEMCFERSERRREAVGEIRAWVRGG